MTSSDRSLLNPGDRAVLHELLGPPSGYTLRQAVGTSFTLDLASALAVPVAFAAHARKGDEDLGILAALSQYGEDITIFCQAGAIRPGAPTDLVVLLEDMIHPIEPQKGLFHPKVWFLEYESDGARCYRFLCLSRNLTDDRSWDIAIRLDGEPATAGISRWKERNKPLANMLRALPELAVRPLDPQRLERIHAMASRLESVEWELPEGMNELDFHVLGIGGARLPKISGREALVISPFVTQQGLSSVCSEVSGGSTLLSRMATIDSLSETQQSSMTYRVIDDAVEDTAVADDHNDEVAEESSQVADVPDLRGLHAKAIFVSDKRGRKTAAKAFIGSANVTAGGLNRNIELMVEFTGHVSTLGPQAILDSLSPILKSYTPQQQEPESEADKVRNALEGDLRRLASSTFSMRVTNDGGSYAVALWSAVSAQKVLNQLAEDGVEFEWHMLTAPNFISSEIGSSEQEAATLAGLGLTDITPFISLKLSKRVAGKAITLRTVVPAVIYDDVPTRRDAIVSRHVKDLGSFWRLLGLLLSTQTPSLSAQVEGVGSSGGSWESVINQRGMFETLLRSLAREGSGLDTVNRLMTHLRQAGEHGIEFPPQFESLWDEVWSVHQENKKGAH